MPEIFVGRRRIYLAILAFLGFFQAILSVTVAIETPQILHRQGNIPLAIALVVAAALIGVARIIERVVCEEIGQDYVRQVRRLLITSALAPARQTSLGITIARTTNDLTAVKNWVSLGVAPIVVGGPLIGGIIVGMFLLVPQIGVVIIVTLTIFAALMWVLSRLFLQKAGKLRKVRGRMAAYITDTVTAGEAIRASGGIKREVNRIDQHSLQLQRAARGRAFISGTMRGSAASITTILSVLVAVVGAQAGTTGATITTAVFIAGMLAAPINDLGRVGEYRQNYRAAIRILIPVIENAQAFAQREKRQRQARERMRYFGDHSGLSQGVVHIADIRDEYGSIPELVARPGARILLTGKSAARVECVLQEIIADRPIPDSWVCVAGKHLYAMTAQDVRKLVGIASRDVPLERGSISRIIRYRNPNSDVDVRGLLEKVGLADVVGALPKGEATVLRRGGEPLTVAQRALVKIARAIAGTPPLLILNQVDDQLDFDGKQQLRQLLADYPGVVVVYSSQPESIMDTYDVWNVDELAATLILASDRRNTIAPRRWSTHIKGAGTDPFGAAVQRAVTVLANQNFANENEMEEDE
ncbi:ABC transporter ATP-binding protein [Arcanobacterium hippocoleae]|uniref:ABC-type multidrug transport system fused ATPase/permease subunit n=1 Tax=Arcanobacterium hippocoleae TaxID=149017 RepID=A0ABU1SZR4_9ACTO|nr:ABC transporter ATP-binding protein [Arcanobacterium hippocoleae]MDR6938598.1 ABC-type multidrug transport system fused ATPase/permease subunit [Arcanobacterium hippocoleae]